MASRYERSIADKLISIRRLRILTLVIAVGAMLPSPVVAECVVLLHGLARSPSSLKALEKALIKEGFDVVNVGYPSREKKIEQLAPIAIEQGLDGCPEPKTLVHFVTHSLGGILVRYYLKEHEISDLGRVVMIAPPNQGSEVVDAYRDVPGYETINGPAGQQLGTTGDSIPLSLGPVAFDLGVIAGTRSVNLVLSLSLPNPDDGKVSVERAKVEGMSDFLEVARSHPFIMNAPEVIKQVIHYLRRGHFIHEVTTDRKDAPKR